MNRLTVIQEIINRKKANTYLEIGVETGYTFLRVKAKKKIAVDPKFRLSKGNKIKFLFRDISNIFNEYYEMTSDIFFETKSNELRKYGLNVTFIDGLHTYAQSLKDVQNCLKLLKEDGVIIMHDCNPPSEAAAHPLNSYNHAKTLTLPGYSDEWCGDVWKTIAYLRSTQANLSVFVLDCDYGLGIITRGSPESMLEYSEEEIDNFSYSDLEKNRAEILNLKDTDYFKKFIKMHSDEKSNKIS